MALGANAQLSIILKLIDQATPGLKKATDQTKTMTQRMGDLGKTLTKNVTLPLVGIGVAAVKAASDMDSAMRNIQSVGKQTNAELKALSQTFVDMSISGEFGAETAAGLAEAFYDIQGAGFAGADAMKVLEASAIAATAGATNTTVAMEGLTAVLNAYDKSANEATDIADLMFRTVDRGVGSYEELAASMSNVVGSANAAGVGFDEVSAALSTMSKQGQSFSEASVALNQIMLEFLKPGELMSKTLNELGYESGLAALEQLGLAGALDAVARQTGGTAEDMANLFGSVRGLRGALALTGAGAEMFAEDLAAMGDAAGASRAAMETQMQSFQNQLQLFKNQFTALLISVGNIILPILTQVMEFITPIVQAFSSLSEGTQKWIVTIGALLATLGPALAIFAKLKSMLSFLTIANLQWAASWALALAPLLLVVAAGVALGAALYEIGRALNIGEHLKKWVDQWNRGIENIKGKLENFVKNLPSKLAQMFINLVKSLLGDGIAKALEDGWAKVKKGAENIYNGIKGFFGIGSPSKLMLDMGNNIGQSLMAGISGGINTGAKQTANTMAANINAMVNGAQRAISGGRGGSGVNYQAITHQGAGSYNANIGTATAGGFGNYYRKLADKAKEKAGWQQVTHEDGSVGYMPPGWQAPVPYNGQRGAGSVVNVNIQNALGTPADLANNLSGIIGGNLQRRYGTAT